MRAPLSWIREFTPVTAAPSEIADALNQRGLEVEAVDEPGRDIRGVVVARVLDVVPHPDADRIRLADVDFGAGRARVVCGAPNIRPGMVVPFAPVGAVLPGDLEIERRTIRGVVSEGMVCSAHELGLGEDRAGILALPDDTPIGTDVREALGLDDVVFDLAITPNRPDAMGIVGVARELAAHFGLPLHVARPEPEALHDALDGATVVVEAPDRCPRLTATVARVTVGPSPEWLRRRLTLAGMRPISNVVDVTNYVMLERCRPLHAFDLGRMAGRGILVRTARDGERMETLDGVERALTADDLLICDAQRNPRAIAGIMGGAEAEVSATTTEIIVESAYFEPSGIAQTSKRLGLRSEASARFERGVDPNGTATGAERAMELLAAVASAERAGGAVDAYPKPIERPRVAVRTGRVNALLGLDLAPAEVRDLLAPLDIDVEGDVAVVPTSRPDLEREIDLVEEVARCVGFARIPRSVPSNPEKIGGLTARQRDRRTVTDVLVGAGYDEIYTLPLLAPADLERAGVATGGVIEVENPLRAEESILRPALLPGALRAVAHNTAHGEPNVALFETGTVFAPPAEGETLPREVVHVAAVRAGDVARVPFEPDRPVEVHDVTAVVEALAQELRLAGCGLVPSSAPGFHPARTARVLVDGRDVGVVGEVAPEVRRALELPPAVVALELDVDALLAGTRAPRTSRAVSRFPASTIDLAFVVGVDVAAGDVLRTLRRAGGTRLEDVRLFDVFGSEALGRDRVSLAFSLRFRAPDRTLTDDEVGVLRRSCIEAVERAHGARLRA